VIGGYGREDICAAAMMSGVSGAADEYVPDALGVGYGLECWPV
jgi:hypothetical protein